MTGRVQHFYSIQQFEQLGEPEQFFGLTIFAGTSIQAEYWLVSETYKDVAGRQLVVEVYRKKGVQFSYN